MRRRKLWLIQGPFCVEAAVSFLRFTWILPSYFGIELDAETGRIGHGNRAVVGFEVVADDFVVLFDVTAHVFEHRQVLDTSTEMN